VCCVFLDGTLGNSKGRINVQVVGVFKGFLWGKFIDPAFRKKNVLGASLPNLMLCVVKRSE